MYNVIVIITTAVWYIWKVLRVDPKSSDHKEKIILELYEWWMILTKFIVVIISQYMYIKSSHWTPLKNMLYNLNIYNFANCPSIKLKNKKIQDFPSTEYYFSWEPYLRPCSHFLIFIHLPFNYGNRVFKQILLCMSQYLGILLLFSIEILNINKS